MKPTPKPTRLTRDVTMATATHVMQALGLTDREQFEIVYASIEAGLMSYIAFKQHELKRLAQKPEPSDPEEDPTWADPESN